MIYSIANKARLMALINAGNLPTFDCSPSRHWLVDTLLETVAQFNSRECVPCGVSLRQLCDYLNVDTASRHPAELLLTLAAKLFGTTDWGVQATVSDTLGDKGVRYVYLGRADEETLAMVPDIDDDYRIVLTDQQTLESEYLSRLNLPVAA